ncbi:hypothetical protein CRUP_036987, partial [Coryphaenoides rupestris]
LELYCAGLELYCAGLELYCTGLELYCAGLELYCAGLHIVRQYFVSPGGEKRRKADREAAEWSRRAVPRDPEPSSGGRSRGRGVQSLTGGGPGGGPGLGVAQPAGPRQGVPRSASPPETRRRPAGDPLARGAAASAGDDADVGGVLCSSVTFNWTTTGSNPPVLTCSYTGPDLLLDRS